jgi:multidrug efflux pump
MKITDIFINKPVLATVVSLFILLLGLRSANELNVRQFPLLQNAVVTVNTVYVGANADLVQGFLTTPLEREIASAEGINYIVSTSMPSVSSIQANLNLDANPHDTLTQIVAKVNKVRRQLPEASEDPTVELTVGESISAMYLSFYSDILDNNQITDYLVRVVEPKLATIPGVQQAQILGDRTFAMRVWLQPDKMAALNLTASDVYYALQQNNVLSAVGGTKGQMVAVDLTAATDLNTVEEFEQLVVHTDGDTMVRLSDIATVELGSESYTTSVTFNGKSATFMGINVLPDANTLDVIATVRDVFHNQIIPQLPEGLSANVPYDSTKYIQDSIDEVIKTIVEAIVIVIVVIFLFLGSLRTVLIPAVTVPLSMIGALFLMLLMGFSINLLTLLAMVLAIGIVVDDAIIMLENVHRHIEAGLTPYDAAIKGARELAWPIIAMTTTLVAVYLPIGFMGGLTGVLFTEFAFTLAGSVLLSGIIALTLSPMMCAKFLKPHLAGKEDNKLESWLNKQFDRLQQAYQRRLHGVLNEKSVVLVFSAIILVSCYFLFVTSPKELEPPEDRGFVLLFSESDPYATLEYLEENTAQLGNISSQIPEIDNTFLLNGVGGGGSATASNTAIAGYVLKPSGDRDKTTQDILAEIQPKIGEIPGIRVAAFVPPSLPSGGGGGFPVEFVIGSTQPVSSMESLANDILQKAQASKKFIFMNTDLKINKPEFEILIDREKAATLGISMQALSNDLSAMLSGGQANRFSLDNRSYKVIPQVQRSDRLTPEQLTQYYTRTGDGTLIPLSTIVALKASVEPQQLKRFQQLNSVTISGVPRPGVPLGEALDVLEAAAKTVLPNGYSIDYSGQSRQYKTEGTALVLTFFFALIVIYLVLAAQFESFRDPIIMLITVPLSVCGAMIFVSLGLTTVNIYTEVGLVTLIGVISKHGILIVEFANKLQLQGHEKRLAIEEAASIRLRPVLMTTAALVLAMVPLLLSTGPGAGARFAMGLVIAAGMTFGTLFTLFVVPAAYLYIARDYAKEAKLQKPSLNNSDPLITTA